MVRLGAVALACASGVIASEAYQLKEAYTPSNFFTKFDFFSEKDPNGGFVKYRTKDIAENMRLVRTAEDSVYIGVDSEGYDQDGRSSVRLQSKSTYNKGLIIADFAHFPGSSCGSWPAFWMAGPTWPGDGEVDIYEGWNLNTKNKVVLHTDAPSNTGVCKIEQSAMSSPISYSNCWTGDPTQPGNTGCAVEEKNGLWANPKGGICEYYGSGETC
jgi:hypothetical protein